MERRIDHVPFAWSDHDEIVEAATAGGLEPRYGGEHADGTTRMSLVAFRDGSYLELIAPTEETTPGETVRWPAHVADDAGPTTWCLETDDPRGTAKRLVDAGESIEGPRVGGRRRPDGARVEWDELFVGRAVDRFALPFFVSDRTPRSYRVPPAWAHDGPIEGVAEVVLGVADAGAWTERLGRLLRLPSPDAFESDALDAELSTFPGRPVSLASPRDGSPLAARLSSLPDGPCAYLLGADDFEAALDRYSLSKPRTWGERRVAWFDGPFDGLLGVVEVGSTE